MIEMMQTTGKNVLKTTKFVNSFWHSFWSTCLAKTTSKYKIFSAKISNWQSRPTIPSAARIWDLLAKYSWYCRKIVKKDNTYKRKYSISEFFSAVVLPVGWI